MIARKHRPINMFPGLCIAIFMPRDKNFLPSQFDVRRHFEGQRWIFMFEVLQHKGLALTQNILF
jgi:hypothetical protein